MNELVLVLVAWGLFNVLVLALMTLRGMTRR